MRAGLLRELIEFKEPKETQSDSGFPRKEYVSVYTCKAYRKKLSAVFGDGMNASEEFIGKTIVFQVRYHPIIKDTQRIGYCGNEYQIKLLDPQVDQTYIITCSKIDR